MSTKADRNAVSQALQLGFGGKFVEDIQRSLRRAKSIDLGEYDGVCQFSHNLTDEEVISALGDLEASGDARCRNGLWHYNGVLAR